MSRPRFSEFLSNRRRQLGLSIAQAARVLKLKDQVLVAFEEGDWDRIPRAGYAQGMLSSYARYLGLNPREVIDLFQEDLHAYNAGSQSRRRSSSRSDAYGDDPLYELPNTTASSPRAHTPGPGTDRDLYGSAGPAGSIVSGNSVSGTYLNNGTPLVSGRAAGYSERYLAENGGIPGEQGETRRYTSRSARTTSRNGSQRTGQRQQPQRGRRAQDNARRLPSSEIQTRRASSFDDDLRYDQASGYESASSSQGRSASHNIARPDRPNVRRRPSAQQRAWAASSKPPKSGVAGVIEAWFSDQRRTMLTVFVLVAVVLIVIITFSVRSCVAQDTSTAKEDTTTAVTTTTTTTSSNGTSTETGTEGSSASKDTDAASADKQAADAKKPVTADVKVADGAVAWIEVLNGGKSLVAGTQTGPWEESYTVDGSLTVRTDDPTDVTVTANGDPVKFETMVSGIGTATVEGPSADDAGATSDGADTSGADQASGSGSDASSASGSDSGTSSTTTS